MEEEKQKRITSLDLKVAESHQDQLKSGYICDLRGNRP